MDAKDAYEQKLRAQLDAWEAEIERLKARAREMDAEAQLEYNRQLDGIRRRQQEARDQLQAAHGGRGGPAGAARRHGPGVAGAGPGDPLGVFEVPVITARRGPVLGCAVLAGLLAGCGGGAGVDFGDPDEERINRGNALEVARLVVGRSMDSVALVALVGQGLVEPVLDPDRAGDFDNAVPTFKCENARTGTVSVTLNDLDNDDLVSEQDTASLSYGNCRDLLLERTLDGTTTDPEAAVVARLEGAAGSNLVPLAPWAIGVDMEMGGLGLTGPDGAGTQLTGLLSTTQRSQDGALIVMETNTVRFTFGDATVGEDVLRNAQTRFQEDNRLTTPTFEVRMEGEVSSTRLGGAFRFETVAPLQGSLGEVPAAGSLRVLGDGNTTMLIRVPLSGGAEVELLVDEDGDGNFDNPDPAPIPITWRQLNFF